MIYFREINIPHYDSIVQKSLDFVKQNRTIFYREKSKANFYWLDFSKYRLAVPEIEVAFDEYNLKCTAAAAHVMYHPSHSGMHSDNIINRSRINLPLLNCKNTFTNFYSGCNVESWHNKDNGLIGYIVTNENEAILEDSIELKQATVFRVSEPHTIKFAETNPVPRISLTLSFDTNPVYLLD
jgi:hypothetical protein